MTDTQLYQMKLLTNKNKKKITFDLLEDRRERINAERTFGSVVNVVGVWFNCKLEALYTRIKYLD